MAIKEAKDLATLPLDEIVCKLKVYEMILKNDGVVSKTSTKEKVKSLALKAKVTREQTSDDSDSQGVSDEDVDKEEAEAFNLMAGNFHKFFRKDIYSGATIDFVMVPIGLEETTEIALGTKSMKAQNKREFATIARNNFEEELFKDMFPTEEELSYHKELLVNFMILEDLGSVIDDRLSEVVLGKPFMQASKLTYDESLWLIRFTHRDDEVVFRMPQRTKELDLVIFDEKLHMKFLEVSWTTLESQEKKKKEIDVELCRKAHLLEDKQIPSVGGIVKLLVKSSQPPHQVGKVCEGSFGEVCEDLNLNEPILECWRTRSTTRYNDVRECELSMWVCFGEGFSKEGLSFRVVKISDEDDAE
ncbi:hypothetical protein Tco_0584338 [Tanacetum coccineum]